MDFDITVVELTKLHEDERSQRLVDLGGLSGLATRLQVALKVGVEARSLDHRRRAFGVNFVPDKPLKAYLSYVCDGFKDSTIRLLCCCAVASILIALTVDRDTKFSWVDGVSIFITVAIVINIQAIQDWSKDRAFQELNDDLKKCIVRVLRDGTTVEVDKSELVVGDIVKIRDGDLLEADGVLVQGVGIECDESALTGNTEDVPKNVKEDPFLFSGTAVKIGTGAYIVTAVGHNITERTPHHSVPLGDGSSAHKSDEISEENSESSASVSYDASEGTYDNRSEATSVVTDGGFIGHEKEGSVLRGKLDNMAAVIAQYAFSAAALVSLIMLLRHLFDTYVWNRGSFDLAQDGHYILEAAITGIAIVVVAVPEGLPLAVTLSLTLSMRKMQRDSNLVKHLEATETMGSATTICVDKTGVLTHNQMTVTRAFLGRLDYEGKQAINQSLGSLIGSSKEIDETFKANLCQCMCLNKDKATEVEWNTGTQSWDEKGRKIDCALLEFAHDAGFNYREICDDRRFLVTDRGGQNSIGIKSFPFSSSRKRCAVAVPLTDNPEGPCRLYLQGAGEIVLRLCSNEVLADGSGARHFGDAQRNRVMASAIDAFASSSLCTVGFAYRDFPAPPNWDTTLTEDFSLAFTGLEATTYQCETELTFLGILGLKDLLRTGVPGAVARCNDAGIDVRMITGEHKTAAIAIAKECGILRPGIDFDETSTEQELTHPNVVLTGEEFRQKVLLKDGRISLDEFDSVWPFLRVLARSTPEDKVTLVTGLYETDLCDMEAGKELPIAPYRQVVVVTGTGTNDAPALRRAHVGFAMKNGGTRVAQDAADILLLDSNFESVVKACLWGRNVYDSIAKFLQFQLTVNVSAVATTVIGSIGVRKPPFTVVQMLWINLIMDSLGALALAAEPPVPELLDQLPHGKDESLISVDMMINILGQSAYQIFALSMLILNAAGPGLSSTQEKSEESYEFEKGGLLNIESCIGRGRKEDPTEHITLVFNCFVMMTLFNWINCRVLHHECNPFKGIHKNLTFLTIWTICFVVQIVLVQAAALINEDGVNIVFKTRALSLKLWGVSLGLGVFSFAWQFLLITASPLIKSCPVCVRWDRNNSWRSRTFERSLVRKSQGAKKFLDDYGLPLEVVAGFDPAWDDTLPEDLHHPPPRTGIRPWH